MSPTRKEQAAAISGTIRTLRDSFTDRIGAHKGKITSAHIVKEIDCLKAALVLVKDPLTPGIVFAVDELVRGNCDHAAKHLIQTSGLDYKTAADRRVINQAIKGESLHADTIQLLTGKKVKS